MLTFGVTIPATVPQRSEIPEELVNYTVQSQGQPPPRKIMGAPMVSIAVHVARVSVHDLSTAQE